MVVGSVENTTTTQMEQSPLLKTQEDNNNNNSNVVVPERYSPGREVDGILNHLQNENTRYCTPTEVTANGETPRRGNLAKAATISLSDGPRFAGRGRRRRRRESGSLHSDKKQSMQKKKKARSRMRTSTTTTAADEHKRSSPFQAIPLDQLLKATTKQLERAAAQTRQATTDNKENLQTPPQQTKKQQQALEDRQPTNNVTFSEGNGKAIRHKEPSLPHQPSLTCPQRQPAAAYHTPQRLAHNNSSSATENETKVLSTGTKQESTQPHQPSLSCPRRQPPAVHHTPQRLAHNNSSSATENETNVLSTAGTKQESTQPHQPNLSCPRRQPLAAHHTPQLLAHNNSSSARENETKVLSTGTKQESTQPHQPNLSCPRRQPLAAHHTPQRLAHNNSSSATENETKVLSTGTKQESASSEQEQPMSEFDDFVDFSEEDLALIDAAESKSSQSSNGANPRSNPGSKVTEKQTDDFDDDPFDALPIDEAFFQELDKKLAEHKPSPVHGRFEFPPAHLPVRNLRSPSFNSSSALPTFTRYKVVSVTVDGQTYSKAIGVVQWNRDMLHSSRVRTTNVKVVEDGHLILRGEWYHTPIEVETIVHLCSLNGAFRTDVSSLPAILHTTPPAGSDKDDDLVMIVHPDMLIPPTIISETISCSRRAVLRSRLGSTGLSCKSKASF